MFMFSIQRSIKKYLEKNKVNLCKRCTKTADFEIGSIRNIQKY